VGLFAPLAPADGALVVPEPLRPQSGQGSEIPSLGGTKHLPLRNRIPYHAALSGFRPRAHLPHQLPAARAALRAGWLREWGPPHLAPSHCSAHPASPARAYNSAAAERGVARGGGGPACERGPAAGKTRGGAERIWAYSTARSSGQRHPSAFAALHLLRWAERAAQQLPLWAWDWHVRYAIAQAITAPSSPRRPAPLPPALWPRRRVSHRRPVSTPRLLHAPDREPPRKPSSSGPNLPAAIPTFSRPPLTLEMGITFGDLSTVLLASGAPEPANYLHRIGRAGRRDGNGPGRHHRHPAPPRPPLLRGGRRRLLRRSASPTGAAMLDACRHLGAAPLLAFHPVVSPGCRAAIDAQALASPACQTRLRSRSRRRRKRRTSRPPSL